MIKKIALIFLIICLVQSQLSMETPFAQKNAEERYNELDLISGDGCIVFFEIRAYYRRQSDTMSNSDALARSFMNKYDTDKDGCVTLEEYVENQ